MSRVAVVGPGGVGLFFAAHLSSAGHEVVCCARRGFDRYVVESDVASVEGPAVTVTEAADVVGDFDVVLVAVKAHQTAGAQAWLDATCGPGVVVVTLQNGAEAIERLTPLVSGATVVEGVVYCGGTLVAPGHTLNSGGGRLILPATDAAEAVVELFADTPAKVTADPGHLTEKWRKLGVNVAVNGVTALTDQPIPVTGSGPGRDVAQQLLHECWTVARAEGADLPDSGIAQTLDGFAKARGGLTSMHQDRRAGRPTEHDAIYGAVLRHAARHGIATPYHQAIHDLLAASQPHD